MPELGVAEVAEKYDDQDGVQKVLPFTLSVPIPFREGREKMFYCVP